MRTTTREHSDVSGPRVGQGGSGEALAGPRRDAAQSTGANAAADTTAGRGPVTRGPRRDASPTRTRLKTRKWIEDRRNDQSMN